MEVSHATSLPQQTIVETNATYAAEVANVIMNKTLQPKRKIKNQAEWKREKRKRSIIAGQSHYSVKGEFISQKEIGSDCKCKLKCYEKVDCAMRQTLFEGFYSLKSYDEQNAYLFGLIRKHDVKRKKNIHSDRRTCTYKYYVRNQGKEIQVCKMAFAHIHAVSFRKIRTLSEKLDQNVLFPRDGRGKHDNRPTKTPLETLDLIKNHIFHIIKSEEFKKFIKEDKNHVMSPELNVAKLYLHFLQTYEQGAVDVLTGQLNPGFTPKVKSWLYRKVFHQEVKSNGFRLERRGNTAVEKCTIEHKDLQIIESEITRNTFPDTKKSQQKGTVSKRTFVSICQSDFDPKCNFHIDKDEQEKSGNCVELNNMHFMTVNSNVDDAPCKDGTQSYVKISQHINNSMNIAEFEDSLNQKSDKLQSVHICPETSETCIYCNVHLPAGINDVVVTSNISVQSLIGNVPKHDIKYHHAEQFENTIKLFEPLSDKPQAEIISSLDNAHTFYL